MKVFLLFNLGKCFLSNYFCENISCFENYLIYLIYIFNMRKCGNFNVFIALTFFIGFTVPNTSTLDRVTFLVQK